MSYSETKPHPKLSPYIDAYWIAEGGGNFVHQESILPDGCVDIILNLKADCRLEDGSVSMESETAYLIGTMTRSGSSRIGPDNKLLGIRFKPASFSIFYQFSSLHEFTDRSIAFEKGLAPDIHQVMKYGDKYLNHFFLSKLSPSCHMLMPVIADIQLNKGQTRIADIAKRHFTTVKQLERHFKFHIGTSPKEFVNLTRYQFAFEKIRNNTTNSTLLQIALEHGYYDHAHLTNEIKKYTGVTPSSL